MRVLVWGLGYVGSVTAACLAEVGHEVIGIDLDQSKVDAINEGRSPIKEPGLDSMMAEMLSAGRLKATRDWSGLVEWADLSLICVGTPSDKNGAPATQAIERVAEAIGAGLRTSTRYHTVALRSTVSPGTTRHLLCPILEETSGRCAGIDFGLTMNPEFLREASAISDFYNPPYVVVGEHDKRAGDVTADLYSSVSTEFYRVSLEEAETIKVFNNAFHALKIGFANEVGRICENLNMDAKTIMRIMCADTKLNISPAYLKPGFAFGGSCLPKDLRSLTLTASDLGVSVPIIESILPSNHRQIESARRKVLNLGVKRVGILGLSFKPGTDDLRESPILALIQKLHDDGLEIRVYDPDVELSKVIGSNLAYAEGHLPDIENMLCGDIDEVVQHAEVVVVCHKRAEFNSLIENPPASAQILSLV